MNFAQLATTVGQRLGVTTSDPMSRDGAAVRSSLTLRHDQLYRAYLWKDAVIEFEVPLNGVYLPTSNYMPTKARVILPPIFQHVLGVRLGWRGLNVQRPMLYFRADYGQFMTSGFTAEFMSLSSCVWEFDIPLSTALTILDQADFISNIGITTDILASDEVTVVRSTTQPQWGAQFSNSATIGTTDRIDNILKVVTAGQYQLTVFGYTPNPYVVLTMQPGDVSAPKSQRIQLVGKPTLQGQNSQNLHILGKRNTPPFSAEGDVCGINGLEGILVALACYDFRLYRDEGGVADASAALIEAVGPQFIAKGVAGGFLGKLIEEEVIQAASNSRIIPDMGFGGSEYYAAGGWNTKGSPY